MPRISLIVVLALGGCFASSSATKADRDETYRCSSPDHRRLAIFLTESGGGAAGFAYEYVDVQDAVDNDVTRVLSLKGGYDVRLRWLDSLHLRIEYPESARIDHWQNWFGRMTDGHVKLVAVPSSGGMLRAGAGGCTSL